MSASPVVREAPAALRPPAAKWSGLTLAGLAVDAMLVIGCVWWATRTSAGMDLSWDLVAYHHYYSWLLSEGLMHLTDPEPYVNRYQNPLAEMPWFLLDRSLSPRATAGAIAAVAALNLLLVRRITTALLPRQVGQLGVLFLGTVAAMVAATGAVFSMELGMSAADVVVSLPMLAAVLLLVRASGTSTRAAQLTCLAAAGVLGGAAVGLKLSMATYFLALGVSAIAISVQRRHVAPALATAVGGAVGVALSSGWWLLQIWRLTGNPVFPYYNAVFGSPLWGDNNVRDDRFGAHSLADAATFPWLMAEKTTRVLDVPMRDLRWIVLTVLLVGACASAGTTFLRGKGRGNAAGAVEARLSFWLFFFVGGILWLFQFGIARYAVTNELLTGTAFVLTLSAILWRPVIVGTVALALAVTMAPFNIGRFYHVPFKRDRFMVQAAPLRAVPSDSVVIAVNSSAPSGFLLEYLPPGTRRHVYQDWFAGTELLRKVRTEQLSAARHIYLVLGPTWPDQPTVRQRVFDNLGLVVEDGRCQTVRSTSPVRHLCPAHYVSSTP